MQLQFQINRNSSKNCLIAMLNLKIKEIVQSENLALLMKMKPQRLYHPHQLNLIVFKVALNRCKNKEKKNQRIINKT